MATTGDFNLAIDTRTIGCDRDQPSYHRGAALSVLARSSQPRDLGRIEEIVASEHDPEVIRAAVVALSRANRLRKPIATRSRRIQGVGMTVNYLQQLDRLPSMVFASRRTVRR